MNVCVCTYVHKRIHTCSHHIHGYIKHSPGIMFIAVRNGHGDRNSNQERD